MAEETKFLYGAAVQGIQGFIFQTNKLKEIAGASDLVEKICTDEFNDFGKPGEIVQKAAGNVKCIFNSREDCERAVREFPKAVMEKAPGIVVSQAVVEMKGDNKDFSRAVQTLENKLRAQRNRPLRSSDLGLIGIRRSRATGFPAVKVSDPNVHVEENTFPDSGTVMKLKASKGVLPNLCKNNFEPHVKVKEKKLPYDVENLTGRNDWIAIIHIDGNGLGQIVQKVGTDKDTFTKFSRGLDNVTKASAKEAFAHVFEKYNLDGEKIIPMRPVVLSGDDHTIICRADLALDYVEKFLIAFEEQSANPELEDSLCEALHKADLKYLTACAGIAYIKSSYPFYYGYDLAEALCSAAKKDAKQDGFLNDNIAQSCLMFHKVQDSFVTDYSDIEDRELTPQKGISFKHGPYYLRTYDKDSGWKIGRWTIDNLLSAVKSLDGEVGGAIRSDVRQWLTMLHNHSNEGAATQKLERLKSGLKKQQREDVEKLTRKDDRNAVAAYDVLSYYSLINQETKR